MSQCDYGLRSKVLKSEIYKEFLDSRKLDYKEAKDLGIVRGTYTPNFNALREKTLNECLNTDLNPEEMAQAKERMRYLSESLKARESSRKQVQRLKQRISTLIESGDCVFLTLTWKTLETGEKEAKKRRLDVVRFLKANTLGYVANMDFGSKNEREHYHAVALIGPNKLDPREWKNGNLDIKRVNADRGASALAKYVSKLTNHAIKETTKRTALIYSRD